jgi:hypothetical protein
MLHVGQRATGLSARCGTVLICIAMAAMPSLAEDLGETRSLHNNRSMQNLDRGLAAYRQQREEEARALEEARLKSKDTCGVACMAIVGAMIFGIISSIDGNRTPPTPSGPAPSPATAPESGR